MTVADIISNARLLADIGTTASVFSATEYLMQVNLAYRAIFEEILDQDDDYFTKIEAYLLAACTPDPDEDYIYSHALPTDFYRLRAVEGLYRGIYHPFSIYGIQSKNNYGQNAWMYRTFGTDISYLIKNKSGLEKIRVRYYPKPVEYTATTDNITFPPQLEPNILAYDVAIAISAKRSDSKSIDPLQQKRNVIFARFANAVANRNNANLQKTQNTFQVY